ncbi:hypothetical protein TRFO_33839 [Tritrichomonas foetus]|uniref:Rab-GAP TBC domain-containing protein n=1 Tax=Tritrichomonas foetus TaxID=1144522 RepID=A0A1J4JQA5_9EUKA|nr:hypothetical protein TRFO_33839 [Tritrichomonas foetus]|eukprot:OHS99709.1 hypothetical protein TRFO_33839 [Tritrichomonas foetus]
MNKIDSSQIVRAAEKLNKNIFTRNDALSFLQQVKQEKNQAERLISWLIIFNIIKPYNIANECARLYTEYLDLQDKFFHDGDPMKLIGEDEEFIIMADTQRSNAWFSKISHQIGLTQDDIKDASYQIPRVLATLTKTDPFYKYTQGYDRYAFITYALGLFFSTQSSLPSEVAESFSYALTKKILRFVDINKILGDMDETQAEFISIDKGIAKIFPDIYKELQKMNHGSFYFALKWQLILFADEHTLSDTFLIWDSIFLRQNDYDSFRADLIMAHLSQIQIDQDVIMIEKIQKYKEWDTIKLINYAVQRYEKKSRTFETKHYIFILYVLLLIVALIYFYFNGSGINFSDL